MLAPIVLRNEAVAILMFAASALIVGAIAFTFRSPPRRRLQLICTHVHAMIEWPRRLGCRRGL